MKKTKIICSIGPASVDYKIMNKLVQNGMNVARINFSHATNEERENVVSSVKKVTELTGKNIGILYDTKGPEFRNGMLENDQIFLEKGQKIRIVKNEIIGNTKEFSVNYPSALNSLSVGNVILLENGLMKIVVESIEEDGITCLIETGGILGNKKSLSVPGVKLDIPFISEIDKNDILYAASHDGDFLALSFVSTKNDVLDVKKLLKENNMPSIQLIAKIESQTGVDNLKDILTEVDGIMVARGDLGVEVPMEDLPFVQKKIIKACREVGKTVIVATEMLESMKKNIRPTRAEVSDITQAVLDGTDAVMLSGETTTGNYPIETVESMAQICENAEKYLDYKLDNNLHTNLVRSAICSSAVEASKILNASLIASASLKGTSAKMLSNLKPNCIILANVPNEHIARSLSLSFGVYPVVVPEYNNTDEVIEDAINQSKKFMKLNTGDIIIITGGFPNNIPDKNTNFMKIEII